MASFDGYNGKTIRCKEQEGEFKSNFLNGKGKRTWVDGTLEEGIFVMSELDGPGKRILPSGALEDGLFEDGQLIEGQAINVKTGTFLNSIFQ